MTARGPAYVLDSDVLMQAHRSYYAFDICSGFWRAIILHHGNSAVESIDKILGEINKGKGEDVLKQWVKKKLPATFFVSTNDPDVATAYGQIVNWVNGRPYQIEAKAEFMTEPDGWLIAYAKAKNRIVVTQEISEPNRINKVKIPDVCDGVGVQCKGTYDFLRGLGVDLKL